MLLYLALVACAVRQAEELCAYHDLSQDEHDDVGRLATRYCVEELQVDNDLCLNSLVSSEGTVELLNANKSTTV